jgi:GntR family transcriptional regulator
MSLPGPDFHPLYAQIKELLIKRVLDGAWKPGEMLPSETKLAAEYGVSQGTVRKALDEMEADHLVVRRQGKGTFVVARESIHVPIHFYSMVDKRHEPITPRTLEILESEVREATADESRYLKLAANAQVLRIRRVRGLDGKRIMREKIVIEDARFPNFAALLENAERANAYLVMEREFGVLATHAAEYVGAVLARNRDVKYLGVKLGDPLLEIVRISYALDGAPVECRTIRLVSENCLYYNELG